MQLPITHVARLKSVCANQMFANINSLYFSLTALLKEKESITSFQIVISLTIPLYIAFSPLKLGKNFPS